MSPFEEDEEIEGLELRSTSIDNLSQDMIDEQARESNQGLTEYARSQRIILPEGATKAVAMREINKSIPCNEYGLPTFFYRSDLMPYELGTLTQAEVDNCVVRLSYDDGYPTFNDGHLFWQQLPAESFADFLLFQRYLDQAMELGLRQIQLLAMDNQVSLEKVNALSHEYCWAPRAKAYDLFKVAADRKKRELRSRNLEDHHYNIAEDLLSTLKAKLADTGDIFKDLSGKELLECLRLLINIQRVSNGLPQNGNAGAVPFNPDAALGGKELMEEITKGLDRSDAGLGLNHNLQELLKDPNFAFEAQSIILRVRQADDPNAHKVIKPVE